MFKCIAYLFYYQDSKFLYGNSSGDGINFCLREEKVENQLRAAYAQVGYFLLFSFHVYFEWFLEDLLMKLMERCLKVVS